MMAAERRDLDKAHENRDSASSDMHRRRRGRNLAMLLVLGALVVLFYVITIVKMSGSG